MDTQGQQEGGGGGALGCEEAIQLQWLQLFLQDILAGVISGQTRMLQPLQTSKKFPGGGVECRQADLSERWGNYYLININHDAIHIVEVFAKMMVLLELHR